MLDLFKNLTDDIKIVRITPSSVKLETDNASDFKNLILDNQGMYPAIDKWLKKKVLPELINEKRSAFIAYFRNKPVISAVVKKGVHAKFCHLKINDELQNYHLGDVFFALMALEVRNDAQEIHFTLPESLWEEKKEFFSSFGFCKFEKSPTQYRGGVEELKCSTSVSNVWNGVIQKLPKISRFFNINSYDRGILLSIRPQYVNNILDGKKTVEIRRRFNNKWLGQRVALYSTAPKRSIVGEAKIANVVYDHPENIWNIFGAQIACGKKEYNSYINGKGKVFAIILDEVQPYHDEVLVGSLSRILHNELVPPQSYCSLNKNQNWANAVSIAELMQSSFKRELRLII